MTENPALEPGERLDSLGIHDWYVIQREDEFRFSIDAVLLAHFATVKTGALAADLGTGTGAVAHFLLARGCKAVTGFEIDPRMTCMANRTAALNHISERLQVISGDIRFMRKLSPSGRFDLVTANPPYRMAFSGRVSPKAGIARACHETTAGLGDFIRAAAFILKVRGRLAVIHLPERLPDLCGEMRNAGMEPKRMRLVHPMLDRSPKMVLIEAVKGARPGLSVMPPLVIYPEPGVYDQEILSYYR